MLITAVAWYPSESAFAQDASRLRFVRWTVQDVGAYARAALARAPFSAVAGATLVVQTTPLDGPILNEVQQGHRGPIRSYLRVTNELGGPHMTSVVAGVFATSLLTRNERFQDASFTSLQSLVFAGSVTGVLKAVFGRHRPEAGNGAYDFAPFSGNSSFPSGHTTAAFAIVTPWVLYYPSKATYGLFALSTGTAVARIARDKHWPSDVIVGATIGYFTARFLTKRHQRATGFGERLSVDPVLSSERLGMTVRLSLD